jgi:N-methylhydantoinase A
MDDTTRTYTVDVDIGGTLTDGLFSDGLGAWAVKVDTTPHDFTVCLFECLREGARRLGFDDLTSFLERVSVIRWSQTIATNVLAERKGPRIGLLVSAGHADDLYGEGRSAAIGRVVAPENIVEVDDPRDPERLLVAVRRLLEQGVRRICVSFAGALEDDTHERAVQRLMDEQFPDHFLGAVPSLLGTEICAHPDDQTRTHMALINAYVHTPMAVALFKAEDALLAEHHYRRPLYIGHVNGGVARVAKTKAIETLESGPVFGLGGAAHFARRYGLGGVISLDVGGTTSKIGVIVDGRPLTTSQAEFLGIGVRVPWVLLRSAALGGGSVARAAEGRVTLGPDSMGAYPGPACYDLGGEEATLTDALVALGMLDPTRFLDGRRQLSVERAREALRRSVGDPLGIDVEPAAERVTEAGVAIVEDAIGHALQAAELDPAGFSLFCFGGNGGNFAAPTAERLGFETAYVFSLGPVLSAFGASVSALSHVHESWPYLSLDGEADGGRLTELVDAGHQRVVRDLEGEGLTPDAADLAIELTVGAPGRGRPVTLEGRPADAVSLVSRARSAGAVLERVAVRGTVAMPRFEPPSREAEENVPEPYATRPVRGRDARLYDWEQLGAGARIAGPAVLESGTNTCTVPAGWELRIDAFLNGVLTPTSGRG